MTPRITLVVAVADNGVIGSKGALPWRIPEDLRRFKALTVGKTVIMGRKTWDSLPKKPLPERTNIVVTRDRAFHPQGAKVAHSIDDALFLALAMKPKDIVVIGGQAIFAGALPGADRIELTEVEGQPEGDAFMPRFDKKQWREIARDGPHRSDEGLSYSFVTLERR